MALVVSVLGLIRSCTNVPWSNVIHFQFTGHKWRIYVTGTLYLAQLIHVCQNELHSNNLLWWMILCFYMYIYNKITLWLVILSLDYAITTSIQRRPTRWYLQLHILAFSGLKFLELLQVVYIGTQSFILTVSYTVLPKLKKKNGIYCSIYLRLRMASGRREACLYRRSWIRWLPVYRVVINSPKKIDFDRSKVKVTGTVHCFLKVQSYHKNWAIEFIFNFFVDTSLYALSTETIKTWASREMTSHKIRQYLTFNM